ncbi:MAG: glycerol-3-phosphate acyltransferase, partial [Gammaproteobacteria bacterium]|nr:glycerol-3-phosphate acyltransferase [Gammaproteobacteria bacterium]
MSFDPVYLVYALAAYLIGSISTAIITCKLMGLEDPRSVGSNNPGATNVLRTGGKKAAIITLLGDMLKGLLP